MDLKASRKDFEGCIILNQGYCDKIFQFMKYELNVNSDNYYNCGVYGWNWSIYSLNRTFKDLNLNVYVINSYRSSPKRAEYINYKRIEKYFDLIIKNYHAKADKLSWKEKQALNNKYIKAITKKLNALLDDDLRNHKF